MKLADIPTIECHPPERRRRTEIRMCHGSCCCCCCCLHTVGGIVGAVIAPKLGGQSSVWSRLSLIEYWEEEENEAGPATGVRVGHEEITERMPTSLARPEVPAGAVPGLALSGISAVYVFWLLSLGATVLGALIGAMQGNDGFIIGLVILALVFPGIQLGCAIITLIWLGMSSRSDKAFQARQVGKVTLGLFLGTLAGILSMVFFWVIMMKR